MQAERILALQVRNKQLTKHFTEKTVKEIWKERMAERKSGKATDLCDFVCNHFQKKIGIMSAVVEVQRLLCLRLCLHSSYWVSKSSICTILGRVAGYDCSLSMNSATGACPACHTVSPLHYAAVVGRTPQVNI